ncbi:MAG: preprotein translocase subunit SecE [Ruminococcaceae bacterium]|nr:preprotein translocase subunit SecE [Oscillospiraceae bacterium]
MSDKNNAITPDKKAPKGENFLVKAANFFKKTGKGIARYFRELIAEIKNIVWPSKKQTMNNTLIVIIVVAIVGVFVAILDLIYSTGIGWLVG